jgi:hypothetical protein
MGAGDTLRSLARKCGRHKVGQINISDNIIQYANENVLIFKYNV